MKYASLCLIALVSMGVSGCGQTLTSIRDALFEDELKTALIVVDDQARAATKRFLVEDVAAIDRCREASELGTADPRCELVRCQERRCVNWRTQFYPRIRSLYETAHAAWSADDPNAIDYVNLAVTQAISIFEQMKQVDPSNKEIWQAGIVALTSAAQQLEVPSE